MLQTEKNRFSFLKLVYVIFFFACALTSKAQSINSTTNPEFNNSIKIACIGNSITYGSGIMNRENNAYPKQLQAMLGNHYQVENFGVSGRTLLKKGDHPYWETNEYQNAKEFNPDIVFIMLGTNDSKQQNRVYLNEYFESDYKELIQSFRTTNKETRIILLLPVPSFYKDSTSIWDPIIKNKIIPLTQKIAFDTNSEVIDLYQLFIDHPNLLPDGIHPSSLGATIIAKRLFETMYFKKDAAYDIFNNLPILEVQKSNFYGYQQSNFLFNNWPCKIVVPKKTALGNPWVWRARFWGHEPQTDIALLERGFHIAYCDVGNLFGGKEAVKRWNSFYKLMTKAKLSKKVVLEGMSRGGLIIYNWAEKNSKKIACIYADAPVLDGKSWPGGLWNGKNSEQDWIEFQKVYGLKTEKKITKFKGNPISKTKSIAKGGYPMFHVVGETDEVVPISENTVPFEKGIKKEGGKIEVIYKADNGHHPHSLKNPTPIVDFILRATGYKVNFADIAAPGSEYRSAAGWDEGKDWWAQANDIDSLCMNSGKVDLLLIGNSITQGFGGNRPHVTHLPGKQAVETYFKNLNIIGAGISGDRTQHVVWRLQNGHYENCEPDFVTLAIGVNNFQDNTAEEIAQGIALDIKIMQEKLPNSKILFYGPLPTGTLKNSNQRKKYDKIHELIAHLGNKEKVHYYNVLSSFCDENGNLSETYYGGDGIHLKPEGYTVWAKLIKNQMDNLK